MRDFSKLDQGRSIDLKNERPSVDNRNAEQDSVDEITELQQAFRDRAKAEQERYADASDGDFALVVVFQSQAQRDEFIKAVGIGRLVDDQYVDGRRLAEKIGHSITQPTPSPRKQRKKSRFEQLT